MKDYFNLKKSKLLLLTLLAFFVGASPAWATEPITETFTNGTNGWAGNANGLTSVGTGWGNTNYALSYYGLNSNYATSGTGLACTEGNSSYYIITPIIEANTSVSFNGRKTGSNDGYIYFYKATKSGDTYTVDTSSSLLNWNSSTGTLTTTMASNTFNVGATDTYVAIRLSRAAIDDFEYTPYVETCPKPENLAYSDVTDESATITWDAGEADTWNLRYKAAGDTDYTEVNGLTSATYAMTGLDAATTYTVEIQTVCSSEEQSKWSSVEFSTPLCSPSAQRNINYSLTDNYGDGWGGSYIKIVDVASGLEVERITISGTSSAYSASGTVALCPNRNYEFVWVSNNNYDKEVGYDITGVDGEEITKHEYNNTAPTAGTLATYSWSDAPVDGAKFAIDLNTFDFGVKNVNDVAEQKFTVTNSGSSALTVTFTPDAGFSVPNYVIFTDALNWGSANVHYWGGSTSTEWPGIAMTEIGTNEFGQKQFKAIIPTDATGIIFNNGSSQTVDITYSANTEGYYSINEQDNGKYKVGSWNAGPGWNVAAGESRDFTVVMNTATAGVKSGNIVLSYDAVNGTETTIPVSGTVLPEGAEVVDFNTEIPSRWTNSGWSVSSQAASSGSNGVLTTQKLDFSSETAPFIIMKVKSSSGYASGDQITIEGSADNGATWTAFEAITKSYNNGDFGNSSADCSTIVISIPNTVNKLRFTGKYVLVDEIIGLKYSDNDPAMGIYTDAECTVAAATSVTKEFGFVTEAPEAVTYYIKNDGTGTMTLTKADVAGFTVNLDKTSVAAGEKATLTIAMPVTDNGGYHGGNVVVTAEGLGTFTVAVSGVVVEDGKFNLDFASQDIPATWTAGNWSKSSSGYAEVGYSSSTMQTSTLVAKANETLVVEAKQSYSSSSYAFGVKYREVGTETWNDLIPAANIGTSWVILAGTITEAGNYEFQFTGNYAQIRRIYGLSKPEAPEMVVYDGEAVAGASYNFGKVTDEADATHTFTVKNEGLATLTGLKAELSGDNADHYTVAIAGATGDNSDEIAAGATATITVTQLKDNLGSHSASLTISATDLDSKEIALSGNTVDHTILNVDFDTSSEWPAEILEHGANWTVYNYNGSGEARQSSTSTATSLLLTPLTVAAISDKLTFDVAYYTYQSSYKELTVSYTTDGGINWTDYNFGTEEYPVTTLTTDIPYSLTTKEITGISAGTAAFKFTGKSIKLDEIAGDMKVTSAPLVEFTKVSDNINGANLSANATANYTLKNIGNDDYVATVAATDVAVAVAGDDVTFDAGTLTVPAGKTATITVTMAYAAPYGEKTGTLAITSESWVGDINASYSAEAVDPTDFVVDFADNAQPAGWYSESWTYNTGAARIYTGTVKPMITEQVGAEDGKNTLKFDALVASGTDEQTLNVYTSTDRKNWSEAQTFILTSEVQNFSLTALEAGNYYVKFEASNAIVDNIKGVKKLDAPAHDLYEVSNTMAETGVPGASYTVKVTAISLRADETVNVELWLKKGDAYSKVASLENEALTANTSREFTLTGDLPAEAGDYTAWITVKNSDNSAYFNTDEKTITLAHVPALTINSFTRISDANVVADENNEFTAEFTVNVTNSGTTDLNADQVSVTLTDGTNAYENATATWTAANSQTVFLNPGGYTTDAKMVLYEWNTDEDGQWVEFTQISDNFYSAELNGKQNFIIARAKTDATEYGFDNGSLYNKSADLNIANGNIYGNDGYNGDVLNLTVGTMSTLAKNVSTTLKVSVTLTAENTSYSFYAKENVKNTSYVMSQSVSVTPYVTVALNETETYDATTSVYGKVTLNRPFIAGWNTLVLPFDVDAETFADKFGEDAVLYELNANNDGELQFKKTTSDGLVAGTPYLLSLSAVVGELTFTDVTVQPGTSLYMHNVNKSGAEFKGNYVNGFDMEGKYGVTPAGQVKKGAAGSTMKAYRAYITMPAGQTARIAIFDETTGISRVLSAKELEGTDIFNMKGQRVSESAKGVVIINGKKVVIK